MQLAAWWTFGSFGMLGWAVAAALPVLIHLWSRRRYGRERWAAMTFLLAALRKNARRIQLEQWLLLAVRTGILLLFATALADPQSSALSLLAGAQPHGATHTVLVLDGSYSMDYRQGGQSLFAAAKERARQLVEAGQEGDGSTLILMSEPPRTVIAQPAFDRQDVLAELDDLELVHAGASLPATLASIDAVLRQAAERQPRLTESRVVFFTDLQQATWREASSPDCRRRLARLEKLATLELVDLGEPGANNLAIARLEIDQPLVAAHTDVQIQADIQSFSREDRPPQAVEVLVDGERVADERVQVPALGRASVAVKHRFDVPGEHIVEVQLADDALPLDNHRWLSVPVAESIRVLLVGGRPGETRELALALAPQKQARGPIQVVEANESRLVEEDLAKFDCVFLCNIGRFSSQEANLLGRYVRGGGGLVVFVGDQVQPQNYNELLGGDEQSRLLPATLDRPAALGMYRLNPLEYAHPIVAPFRGFEQAGLLTTPIWKYIHATPAAGAKTALAFENGEAAIVTATIGRGRSILVTTAAAPDSVDRATNPPTPWNALAAWPSFPPLVQEMLRFAIAGRSEGRNVLVGEELTGTLPATAANDQSAMLSGPGGLSERLPLKMDRGEARYSFDQTARSGVYEVRSADAVRRFAVNVKERESDLTRVDAALLPPELHHEATLGDTSGEMFASSKAASRFRWLLGAVLVLLVVEPCLAWRLGRGRA
jgi:hypothetical protein